MFKNLEDGIGSFTLGLLGVTGSDFRVSGWLGDEEVGGILVLDASSILDESGELLPLIESLVALSCFIIFILGAEEKWKIY